MSECLKDIDIVILCGGLGTRIAPLLGVDLPKCLAPINGRPVIEYQIDELKAHGAHRFIMCAGYRADRIKEWAIERHGPEFEIELSIEAKQGGTAAALLLARPLMRSKPVLILNGDTIVCGDYPMLVESWNSEPISVCVNGVPTGLKLHTKENPHWLSMAVDATGLFTFIDIGTPDGYRAALEAFR